MGRLTVKSSCTGHVRRSTLFNPEISIVLAKASPLIGMLDIRTKTETHRKTGVKETVLLRVVSEGRRAYVKFLE